MVSPRFQYSILLVLPFFVLILGNCSQVSPEEKKAKHYEQGMVYFEQGQYKEALIEFKNVVQIAPDDAQGHYQLALTHLKLGGTTDLQSAFGELTKTVNLDPSIQDAQLKLGEFFLLGQKSDKAREKADIVLASSPQDPKGHLLRGRSLIIDKEYEEGIAELKRSIELDPDNVQIYIDLARAYLGMKDSQLAEQTLQNALTRYPKSTELVVALGDLQLVQNKPKDAENFYRKARDLDPENGALSVKLAKFYQATQKWDAAEDVYNQLATRQPKSENPQLLPGRILYLHGATGYGFEKLSTRGRAESVVYPCKRQTHGTLS